MNQNKFQNIDQIFSISNEGEFESIALEVFNYQYTNNKVYQTYCRHLKVKPQSVTRLHDIPFLPISLFKTQTVICGSNDYEKEFTSSGTTGMVTSSHFVKELGIYETSFIKGFETLYGKVEDYIILGLLPSYLEKGSC